MSAKKKKNLSDGSTLSVFRTGQVLGWVKIMHGDERLMTTFLSCKGTGPKL